MKKTKKELEKELKELFDKHADELAKYKLMEEIKDYKIKIRELEKTNSSFSPLKKALRTWLDKVEENSK